MNTNSNDSPAPQDNSGQPSIPGPLPITPSPQPPQAAPTAPLDHLDELFPPIVPWPEPVKGDELLDAILSHDVAS